MIPLKYLQAYPASLQDQVRQLIAENRLSEYLERHYLGRHDMRSDKALYIYTVNLKQGHLRNAPGLDRMLYDSKLGVIQRALSLYTTISWMQSGKLKAKKEIRVVSLFKDTAPEFPRMIVVHELAHLKESKHNKTFYQLCQHMLPDYHQLEFDLRMYLAWESL